MKSFIALTVACFLYLVTYAQDDIIRWNENYKLQWTDFEGSHNIDAPFYAFTSTGISLQLKSVMNGSMNSLSFEVYAKFNKNKSWGRAERLSDELLRHEQLHFDIAELFARKLRKELEKQAHTISSTSEIFSTVASFNIELDKMQNRYDSETNHFWNKKKQKKWETYVSEELLKMGG